MGAKSLSWGGGQCPPWPPLATWLPLEAGITQSLHYKCNGCYVSYKGHLAEHAIRHKIAEGVNMM